MINPLLLRGQKKGEQSQYDRQPRLRPVTLLHCEKHDEEEWRVEVKQRVVVRNGRQQYSGNAQTEHLVHNWQSPELIAVFPGKWLEGADVVYGVRVQRAEGFGITAARSVFYRLIDMLSEEKLPVDAGDFRLISRRIIDLLCRYRDANPYLRGTIATLGFKQVGVEYVRQAREHGKSKFPFSKLVSLAIDGILNHSTLPLRFATYFGLAVSVGTLAAIAVYVVLKLALHADWPAGFTTLAALILLSISVNAMLLGIIGEYLGRMYRQVREAPITIIEAVVDRELDAHDA